MSLDSLRVILGNTSMVCNVPIFGQRKMEHHHPAAPVSVYISIFLIYATILVFSIIYSQKFTLKESGKVTI